MNLSLINSSYKNIIFDFDGVILDSVPVKTEAFRILFQDFKDDSVNEIIKYHKINGGLSRYKKIEYFFISILKQSISEEKIIEYAYKFSEITLKELPNPKYIIEDTLNFIKNNYKKYNMHIASGSSEEDLKYICDKLDLTKYFISINGSPKEKSLLVEKILHEHNYEKRLTCLIGDSINDYEAAKSQGISFFGYNNDSLEKISYKYINSFGNL